MAENYRIQYKKSDNSMETLHPETNAGVVTISSTKTTATNVKAAIEGLVDGKANTSGTYSSMTVGKATNADTAKNYSSDGNIATSFDACTTNIEALDGAIQGLEATVADCLTTVEYNTTSKKLTQKKHGLTSSTDIVTASKIVSDGGAVLTSSKGVANGVASLDANGKVPSAQLPSFVDDVLEYNGKSYFPTTGEAGKIYVAKDTNLTYRWSGSAYVEISPSIALGETSSTAYAGDKGKANATAITALQTGKQDKLTAQTAYSAKGSATKVPKITTNSLGQVTAIEEVTITQPTKSSLGLGSVDNTSDATKFSNFSSGMGNTFDGTPSGGFVTDEQLVNIIDDVLTNDVPVVVVDEAVYAASLKTARNIALSGAVTGNANFDGSANITISTTLKNSGVTAGTYSAVTVDAKGIVTAGGKAYAIAASSSDTAPADLAIGGIFYKKI